MRSTPLLRRGDAGTRPVATGHADARLAAAVVGTSALAWLAIVLGHGGTTGDWHGPLAREEAWPDFMAVVCGRPPAASDPLAIQLQWLGGWALMVLAMMLPPALPFLRAMSRVGASHRAAVVVLAAAAFAACWMAVGVALLAVAAGLSALVEQWPLLSARPALVSGLVAVAAGLFQFTPWKQACLVACRRPDGLILMAWRREAPRDAALRIGARYAAVCIGCCVPLMLLTIAVGAFALPLMVIVSVAMLFERTLPSVRALIPLQAALAVVIGLALLAGALPAGIGTAPPASLSLRGG